MSISLSAILSIIKAFVRKHEHAELLNTLIQYPPLSRFLSVPWSVSSCVFFSFAMWQVRKWIWRLLLLSQIPWNVSPSELGFSMLGLKNLSFHSNPTEADTNNVLKRPQSRERWRVMQSEHWIPPRVSRICILEELSYYICGITTLTQGW